MDIIVEGWRFLPHSYAVVNQFQCLELLKRPDVRLFHRDMPFFKPHWKTVKGWLPAEYEEMLRNIPAPADDQAADACYRIAYPYDFNPSRCRRTAVSGTCELPKTNASPIAMSDPSVVIVTPSNWSRQGFVQGGADPARIAVVPHGIDPAIFHPPSAEQRQAARKRLGVDGFVFLNIGAMSLNKGIDRLLRAFAVIVSKHPHARLLLKGSDLMFQSQGLLRQTISGLSDKQTELIMPRITYGGHFLSFVDMAMLYHAADAYVTPYLGEGFSLPTLEAIACGLPVICTAGGATDDFTTEDFAMRIRSRLEPAVEPDGSVCTILAPEHEHLIELMQQVIEQPEIGVRARVTGPAFVQRGFTWAKVVDRLLEVLRP